MSDDRKTALRAIAADARTLRDRLERLNADTFNPSIAKAAIDLAMVTDTLLQVAAGTRGTIHMNAAR